MTWSPGQLEYKPSFKSILYPQSKPFHYTSDYDIFRLKVSFIHFTIIDHKKFFNSNGIWMEPLGGDWVIIIELSYMELVSL